MGALRAIPQYTELRAVRAILYVSLSPSVSVSPSSLANLPEVPATKMSRNIRRRRSDHGTALFKQPVQSLLQTLVQGIFQQTLRSAADHLAAQLRDR